MLMSDKFQSEKLQLECRTLKHVRNISNRKIMNYQKLFEKALKGKNITEAARAWGIPQPTLRKYARGERIPTYEISGILAKESGISIARVWKVMFEFEKQKRAEKLPESKL